MSDRGPSPEYEFFTTDDGVDLSTQIIHDGESPTSSAFPIYQSNTVGGIYIRMRNPTIEALEEKIRRLEGGTATVAMSCGMAAVSHTLLGLLQTGSRVVVHKSIFIGVQTLLKDYVSKLGIDVVQIDLNSPDELANALKTPTRLVYFETISNPGQDVVDVPAVIATAHSNNALVAIDNTVLTPFLFRPLELGADIVIHSGTKYLAGHGDVLAGFATFQDKSLADQVHKTRRLLGGMLSPHSAFLVMRGVKSLPLRITKHCQNAQQVAEFLHQHPRVQRVLYPGLPSNPTHTVAKSFLKSFGGMVCFDACEPFDWECFKTSLRLCRPGMSFGDAATRIQKEGHIRLTVGLEDARDIIRYLQQAFAAESQ